MTDYTVTYKPENRVTTYEEYLSVYQTYPGHKAPESEIFDWYKKVEEYEILYSGCYNIYDVRMLELVGTIPLPEDEVFYIEVNEQGEKIADRTESPAARSILLFHEDKILLYSKTVRTLLSAPISTIGSPEFAWTVSSRVN